MNKKRSYSELKKLKTFKERYLYLQIHNPVSEQTFAGSRYLNQKFYSSQEWKEFRNRIIVRDCGCDLAMDDGEHEIHGHIYIHHLNPLEISDLKTKSDSLLDPENVVCVSFKTHNAIHYGSYDSLTSSELITRKPGDTTPWKGGLNNE